MREKERIEQESNRVIKKMVVTKKSYAENTKIIKNLELDIENLKPEIKLITKLQLDYYYGLLHDGNEIRLQGLSWIIKTIWYLKGNLSQRHFPRYLDNSSIEYLIMSSRIDIQKENLIKKLKEILIKEHSEKQSIEDVIN